MTTTMSLSEAFKVLGLKGSVSRQEARKHYFKLAKQFHPDAHDFQALSDEQRGELTERFLVLNDAWMTVQGHLADDGDSVELPPAEVVWRRRMDWGGSWHCTIADGVIYCSTFDDPSISVHGVVHAIDLQTGEERWRYRTGGQVYSHPRVEDGVVLCSDQHNQLYALDAEKPQELWRVTQSLSYPWDYIAVGHGLVYCAGLKEKAVCALDIRTGKLKWRFKTLGNVGWSIVLHEDKILFTDAGRVHYALEARTGKELWKAYNGKPVGQGRPPGEGPLRVRVSHKLASASTLFTDEQKWSHRLDWTEFDGPAPLDNGKAFVTDFSGAGVTRIRALALETGKLLWKTERTVGRFRVPVLHRGVLHVAGEHGYVLSFDPETGQELWQLDLGPFLHQVEAAEDMIVASGLYGLYGIRIPDSGSKEHETQALTE